MMKKVILTTFAMLTLLAGQSFAQTSRDEVRARMEKKRLLMEQGIQKWLVTVDYNSWFEQLTIANTAGTTQESQALYFGFGLGVEKNWYHSRWGWGLGAGVLGGSATGGDKSGSLNYFSARVPWTAVRLSPRVFYRWTGRTDLGLDLAGFYKTSQWPDSNTTVTVRSGSDVITGAFLDLRVRFSSKFEMIQAFGMVYKDASLYWRLGMAYRL